jgi:hypothetical protein
MSGELKRKLYNYEAEPPETVWSRIVTALDQEINAEFPKKLHDLEAPPPFDGWNRIEERLEEDIHEQYPIKLYNLEVVPPPRTWNKILALLDEEKAIPEIPSKRRIISFVRYAVAACIIGLLAFGTFTLLNQKTDSRKTALQTVIPRKDSSAALIQNPIQQLTPPPSNNLPREGTGLAQIEPKPRKRTSSEPAVYMTQMAATFPAVAGTRSISDFRQVSLKGEIPGNCSLISDADPYLMFVNPDGYLIRISKKLAETLGCIYTNGNSNEYNRCQDQIKKWRDKIAQSPATSSPDNFMDILNVIRSVQE